MFVRCAGCGSLEHQISLKVIDLVWVSLFVDDCFTDFLSFRIYEGRPNCLSVDFSDRKVISLHLHDFWRSK
jgi:hypothetical protein